MIVHTATIKTGVQLDLLERDWIYDSSVLALEAMTGKEYFTSDDLHECIPAPSNLNWWGALIASMRSKGMIHRVGYGPSKRPEANGRVVALWRVKEDNSDDIPRDREAEWDRAASLVILGGSK